MRIALISEGCYPFAGGGVTTWCDQLVRGLPQHEFEVVTLLGDGSEQVTMPVPDNVAAVRRLPLWGPARGGRRVPRQARAGFEASYGLVLAGMLGTHRGALSEFVTGLRELHAWGAEHDLRAALASECATTMLLAHWEDWSQHAAEHPMSLQDALTAADLLEHLLRPLSEPAPQVDLCHPVSNGLPTLVAMTAQWTYGTPIVMSEHGVFLRERYLALREFACGWPVKNVLLGFYRRLSEAGYAAADVIAPVNVFNQRWEVRGGADPDRIVTAYNGVDPTRFDLTPEPERPTLGWVGRIDPLKDLETLVRGFAAVREQLPSAVLRLFGPVPAGNEAYAEHLAELVADLGLRSSVTFEGPVSPVSAAYRACSVVALTSISEGLPYTVIEAMMSGRATVSSDVGGVAEVVGDTGLLVPAGDPEAFSRACLQLLQDDADRAARARAGRDRARRLFDLDRMLGMFGSMYAELPDAGTTGLDEPASLSEAV